MVFDIFNISCDLCLHQRRLNNDPLNLVSAFYDQKIELKSGEVCEAKGIFPRGKLSLKKSLIGVT
jgi:hypothetical protein